VRLSIEKTQVVADRFERGADLRGVEVFCTSFVVGSEQKSRALTKVAEGEKEIGPKCQMRKLPGIASLPCHQPEVLSVYGTASGAGEHVFSPKIQFLTVKT
jgi:hypothetical protein